MTNEEIEKAADAYAEREYPNASSHIEQYSTTGNLYDEAKLGFEAGAQFALQSVGEKVEKTTFLLEKHKEEVRKCYKPDVSKTEERAINMALVYLEICINTLSGYLPSPPTDKK